MERDPGRLVVSDYVQQRAMWGSVRKRVGALHEVLSQTIERYTAAIMVPVTGRALQRLGTSGFDPDGFMARRGSFAFRTTGDVATIEISGWLPEQHGAAVEIHLACGDAAQRFVCTPGAPFTLTLEVELAPNAEGAVTIELSSAFQPSSVTPGSPDTRLLGCLVLAAAFA